MAVRFALKISGWYLHEITRWIMAKMMTHMTMLSCCGIHSTRLTRLRDCWGTSIAWLMLSCLSAVSRSSSHLLSIEHSRCGGLKFCKEAFIACCVVPFTLRAEAPMDIHVEL